MAEAVQISGPVRIESDSVARAAFDLMVHIARNSDVNDDQKDENFWLELYGKCLKATGGLQ